MFTVPLALFLVQLSLTNFANSLSAPTISPASNALVAVGSPDNVTYTCTSGEDDVFWELNGRQITGEMTKARYRNNSIFVEDQTGGDVSSDLIVTLKGREVLGRDPVPLLCYAFSDAEFYASPGKMFYIIQFETPSPPRNLQLNYQSEDQVKLQWERPADLHEDVIVTYLVQIANLTNGNITQEIETTATHVLINQMVEETCQPHSFTITARNDAGVSNGTSIQESIPISPDVFPITSSQKVEQVLFIDNTNVNITISFEPATNCSTQFPVLNYTVSIEGLEGGLTIEDASAYSSALSVVLSSSAFPELVQDQQYSITITACTNFTCRSPPNNLLVVTTDVQSASIIFYERDVSLSCTFAVGSSASACLFVLTLTNNGQTENVSIPHTEGYTFNTSCDQLNHTVAAYDMPILVYGIDSDGTVGSQSVNVSVTMESEEENFTCSQPSPSAVSADDKGITAGAISGIAVGGTFTLVLPLFILALIFLLYWMYKIHKDNPQLEWKEKMNVKFVIEEVKRGITRADDDEGEPLTAQRIEVEAFPVARIVKASQSVTIQLLQSPAIDKWLSEKNNFILLYPIKQQEEQQEQQEEQQEEQHSCETEV